VNYSKWFYILTDQPFWSSKKVFDLPASTEDAKSHLSAQDDQFFSQQPLNAQHMLLKNKVLFCRKMTGIQVLKQMFSSHLHSVSSLSSF